ncbi:hypothetical protein BDU57DRAFT_82461 [Ampelomyces quisqualis]|uniref:Uncharacterized protein n=1 Tax=Ampelomyces quisqualis TaxID=50730 RepID=A0A6A5Q9T7_AMPQU|nr:hypothetical protein BDU57DRAFT_82461 [Ampelomyces quisqualis]
MSHVQHLSPYFHIFPLPSLILSGSSVPVAAAWNPPSPETCSLSTFPQGTHAGQQRHGKGLNKQLGIAQAPTELGMELDGGWARSGCLHTP